MRDEAPLVAPESATTAWRRIADDLAARFVRGDYETGAALPPAQVLARQFGVHRHTARQAYIHLQERGLISIRRGAGAFFTGIRLPYRIGRRVRLRDNLRTSDLAIASRMLGAARLESSELLALDLAIEAGAPVWRIDMLNSAGDLALSLGSHFACASRFPDLPERLARSERSFTAAFASYGLCDYERRATQITARLPRPAEAARLGVAPSDPVLATRALDVDADRAPLQVVEAIFRADRIELRVEPD